jgi:predicted alpha/beta-fold hydrolase
MGMILGELGRQAGKLVQNPHLQTVLGNWLRWPEAPLPSRERFVLLDDGDRLVLHDSVPSAWRPGRPIALIVHGLVGSARSAWVQRLAVHLRVGGLRVVRIDLRGSGRGIQLARRPYHAGCSDDLRAAAHAVHRWSPESPLVLVGLSLGGNIVLKLAGEAAGRPVPGLQAVAAAAPPIDLVRCAQRIARPQNQMYERHFIRGLVRLARRRQRLFPDLPRVPLSERMTLRQFDDCYTAPRCGFAGADDYYRRASSWPLIHRINVPALIVTARDDPIVAIEPFDELPPTPHLRLELFAHGGHLGFVGWRGLRWIERHIADWVVRHSTR